MEKALLAAVALSALTVASAQAACLTTTHAYSGIVQANSTTTAHGPVTIINGATCRSVVIAVRIGSGSGRPDVSIEKQDGAVWRQVAKIHGNGYSIVNSAGTYRVIYKNNTAAVLNYNGSVAITR